MKKEKETPIKEISKETALYNGGWGVMIDDEDLENKSMITNFKIEVSGRIDIYSGANAKPITYAELRLAFRGGSYSDAFTIPQSDLDKVRWNDIDVRCCLNPAVTPAMAQRYLALHIKKKLSGMAPKKRYRPDRLGIHILEDEPGFCTGGGGYIKPSPGATNDYDVQTDHIEHSLDIDANLSEEEATTGTLTLLSLFPNVGRILLTYNLLCLMWELYKTVRKAPNFCLYIYGVTSSLKTTLSAFFSQIYDRSKGISSPPRLNSSPAKAVELILEKAHCAIILDDLFPSDFSQQRRKQEETLSEIVRIIGDGVVPGRYNRAMDEPTVGVEFTAEYLIGIGSDAARLLPIEVTPPSKETLQRFVEFQSNPLMLSTFYHNFIQWFVTNYDWVLDFLKNCWEKYSNDFTTCYGEDVHDRLRESHYFMNTAYTLFLEYCHDQECITTEEAKGMQQSFLGLLTELVLDQQSRVDQCKDNSVPEVKVDYLAYIRKLYKDGAFKLASSAKEFDKTAHDGVEHLDRLYLYGKRFREIISAAHFTPDNVLDDLKAKGALHHDKDERSTQLVVSPKKKHRCYAIKLTHLR